MHATTSPTKNLAVTTLLLALLFCCFALGPKAYAALPAPPPDGGYPNGNTAEGFQALFSLTSGSFNTALGQQALFSNTIGSYNSAEGFRALFSNTTGIFNTATGLNALYNNTTGRYNTATGAATLFANTTGNYNEANGLNALFSNTTGTNNAANGAQALYSNTTGSTNTGTGGGALYNNTTGSANTAHGFLALFRNTNGGTNAALGDGALMNNTTGDNNIALGADAGFNLTTGNNNIDIGNVGVAGESGKIRIGTNGTHTDTFLTGVIHAPDDVGIGVTTPATRLHVAKSSGNPASPAGHVALIKENSIFTACLALQSGFDGVHNSSDNFITFFNSDGVSIGSIEGNGAGSVQLSGAGSDYAEYLTKANPAAQIEATQIVGVAGGRIVPRGAEADQYMVVTAQAIVAGNRPSENEADLATRGLVSFVGQVPVQVRGPVKSGDFILASEKADGTGIAKRANKVRVGEMHRVVGRAWESSAKKGLKQINTAVGLDQTSLVVPALERLERENQELRAKLAELEASDQASEARLSRLENDARVPVYRPLPPR